VGCKIITLYQLKKKSFGVYQTIFFCFVTLKPFKILKMKKTGIIILFAICTFSCKNKENELHKNHNTREATRNTVLSPKKFAMTLIDDAHIHMDYSAPSVRGRIIFGGLLAYGELWQAGAHNVTTFETNKDLAIEGKTLKAGKYGFFALPNKTKWTLIFNSNWDQHGKDEYDSNKDVLRIDVVPERTEKLTEQLNYKVIQINEAEGKVILSWEKTSVSFSFSIVK